MKISLITIWHIGNYGAEMQSYATIKTLQEMGHDVSMIDIRLTDALPKSFKYKIASLFGRTSLLSHKYEKFWRLYFPTTRRYHSIQELRTSPPVSDVYLVGSDQVWNPALTTTLAKAFFLDFGDSSTRRVAYASSFGFAEFPDEFSFKETYLELLANMDAISCREESGVQLLQKLGIDSINVLDPTLLRRDYHELTGEISEMNSLVFYPIGNNLEPVELFAIRIAEQLNLTYSNLMHRSYKFGRLFCDGLSVQDWIRSIASAKIIVTTSFHGVAFSLVYQRQFVVIISNRNRASRITNLLNKLNLSDRYFYTVEDAQASNCWETQIDYEQVSRKLETLRIASVEFLKHALDGKD